ncbi:hypothetical protein JF66_11070 [Cryobacterium sp. MLB-32]|uniref:hypothetical protein n=1 Tax=Cryobacterium sp. MLB-32 TaxID=1529318 RepID=UPI0004E6D9A2|nr:hypothetical protein [Cryobacterium sp. MLB-32]KFF59461.1 hypothetical protein JF66_11070 [Cryobacterium sp. MLB-32]
MTVSNILAELRRWTRRRWAIAAAVAAVVGVGLALASGAVAVVDGALGVPGSPWALALTAVGAGMVGLVVASYFATPIGAEATMCDLRWPVLGVIAILLSTDLRADVPMLTGIVRPVVALAAIALLAWAARERLEAERRAVDETGDGDVCTTCRPLLPGVRSRA